MRRHQALRPVHIVLSALLPAALWVSLAFAAGAAKPPPLPPPPPSDSLAYIRQITFGTPPCEGCAPRVCPGEPVVVTVSGLMPARCVAFRGLHEEPAGGSHVLAADFVVDTCGPACPTLIVPFSARIDLPAQAAGRYTELFVERVRVCPDTTAVGSIRTAGLAYEVVASCPVEPPPLDSLVRTFASLRVRPEHPCPGDSLRLEFDENGCPPCVHLVSLGRDPDNHLRAVLEWRPHCVEFACISDTLSYALGRFAAGSYVVTIPVDVHVLDAGTPDSTISFEKRVAFDVQRVCGVPEAGCLHSPLPPRGSLVPECSLRVPPGGHGDVLVPVRNDLTATGVAGVEGFMATFQPFHIVDIRYAGAATGVHVSWRQDGQRSRFVVFGTTPDVVPPGTSDLVRVTVAADSLVPPDIPGAPLYGAIELASDPNGEQIPICPEPLDVVAPLRLCIDRTALGCDVNHDGHADVRDLVLMARCLRAVAHDDREESPCFDCDGDGTFGIPDLFCCAHEILHGPGISHDSTHVQAGLDVSIDKPVRDGDAVRVRLHVRGASSLGAALLRLRYPADRWQVLPPENIDAGFPAGWLPLVDAGEAGLLRLGALRLADAAADELVYELRAVPLAGTEQSGSLSVEGADLTAPDGAMLSPASPLPSTALSPTGPATVVELSPASPNPFTHSTTFAISLPRDAEVDLTVHDLAGRRVATLAHGRLGAGRRSYAWEGGDARDGVYFVRLTVDGRTLATRVALLRGGR